MFSFQYHDHFAVFLRHCYQHPCWKMQEHVSVYGCVSDILFLRENIRRSLVILTWISMWWLSETRRWSVITMKKNCMSNYVFVVLVLILSPPPCTECFTLITTWCGLYSKKFEFFCMFGLIISTPSVGTSWWKRLMFLIIPCSCCISNHGLVGACIFFPQNTERYFFVDCLGLPPILSCWADLFF